MKRKKFLKSANRGIILALVLAVVLVIYVIADQLTFQHETDKIDTQVRAYVDDYFKCLLVDTGDATENGWSKDLMDKKKAEYSALMDKYAVYGSAGTTLLSDFYCSDRATCEENLDYLFEDEDFPNYGFITEVQYSVEDVKIKKYGPNGALLTCAIDYTTNGIGYPAFMLPSMEQFDTTMDMELPDGSDTSELIVKELKKGLKTTNSYNFRNEVEFILTRDNGEWKISLFGSNGTSYSSDMEMEVDE